MRKRNIRKPVDEFLFLLGVGGSVYYGVEVLFRGFSHWSMFLLGGLCLVLYKTGAVDTLDGSALETDSALYGVYHIL